MDAYLRPTDNQCMHFATIDLNGRQLCVKHAGPYALTLALESGEAKRIPLTRIILSGHRFVDRGKFVDCLECGLRPRKKDAQHCQRAECPNAE